MTNAASVVNCGTSSITATQVVSHNTSHSNFTEGAPMIKLTVAGGKVYAGNATSKFEPTKPFAFLPVRDK